MASDPVEYLLYLARTVDNRKRDQRNYDTAYVPITVAVLGAEGLVAAYSQLDSWSPVILDVGICIVGLLLLWWWGFTSRKTRAYVVETTETIRVIAKDTDIGSERIIDHILERTTKQEIEETKWNGGSRGVRIALAVLLILIPATLALATYLHGLPQFHDIIHPVIPR